MSALFGLVAVPALAKAAAPEPWVVSQRTGNAQVLRAGVQPAALTDNAVLAPGDIVVTGANGRVMLTHARDYVVVAPSSRLMVPREERPGGITWLIQQVGTVLYKVHHTGIPHFTVEAPMLAAVVKGTSFVVIVDQDRSAVQVTDGIVDVSATAGGEHRLVEKGHTVFINHDNPRNLVAMAADRIDISGSNDKGSAVTIAGSTQASLTPISTLTSGLVREVPDQAVSAQRPATVSTSATTSQPSARLASAPSTSIAPVSTAAVAAPAVTVGTATVAAPSVLAVSTPTVSIAPTVAAPTVAVSAAIVAVPSVLTVTAPTVAIAPVTAPTVSAPAVTVGPVTVAVPSVLTVSTPTVTLAPTSAPTVSAPVVSVPVLPKIVAGLFGR